MSKTFNGLQEKNLFLPRQKVGTILCLTRAFILSAPELKMKALEFWMNTQSIMMELCI